MQIRPATLNDIPEIMKVIGEVIPIMRAAGNYQWDSTYPNPGVFESDITAQQLWVADVNGDIAGVAALTTEQYPEYAQVGWDIAETAIVIHRLAVSPRYRGQGIADALVKEADYEALRRGLKLLRIDTNAENKVAQKVFLRAGYIFGGEISLEFRPGLRFYCYQKVLD